MFNFNKTYFTFKQTVTSHVEDMSGYVYVMFCFGETHICLLVHSSFLPGEINRAWNGLDHPYGVAPFRGLR